MRRIKNFRMFESTSNTEKKDLDWLKSFLEESKSDTHEYKLEVKSGKDGKHILLSNGKHQIELYDNDQDNNFFYVRIKEGNNVIQDFKKSNKDEGYSQDEIPSENIIQYVGKYFQKI